MPALSTVRYSRLKKKVFPSAKLPVDVSAVAPTTSVPPVTPRALKYIGRSARNAGPPCAALLTLAEIDLPGPTPSVVLLAEYVARLVAPIVLVIVVGVPPSLK